VDDNAYWVFNGLAIPWPLEASSAEIRKAFDGLAYRGIREVDQELASRPLTVLEEHRLLFKKATLFNYEGDCG
jgi:hypothetical protein